MRFIIKALFWFGVVLLFLPGNTGDDAVPRGDSPAVELRELAIRIQRICFRDPELCRAGAAELLTEDDDEIARLLRNEAALLAASGD